MIRCFKLGSESSDSTHDIDERSFKIQTPKLQIDSEQKVCRICYEIDDNVKTCPCKCIGSHAYAHLNCLKLWISEKFPKIEDSYCEICKMKYKIKASYTLKYQKPDTEDKKTNSYCKLAILFISLLVMICITIIVSIFHVDLNSKFGYSVSIICACMIPIGIIIGFIIKVFISNYFIKILKSWTIKGFHN